MVKRWYENKVSGMMKGQALFLMRTRPMPGTHIVIGWRSSLQMVNDARTRPPVPGDWHYLRFRPKRVTSTACMQPVCCTTSHGRQQ